MSKILVVDDEESFVEALRVGLSREGFDVVVARDGVEAIEVFAAESPDLVLLDVMLPRLSGVDVCRKIRTQSSVPVIMVSAKSAEIDTVVGLEVGADDYIAKPYRLREVVARIRAVLRRSALAADPTIEQESAESRVGLTDNSRIMRSSETLLTLDDVTINLASHEVFVRDALIGFPLKEFDLLEVLIANAGRVMTRELLIEKVWGYDYFGDTKTLDVHVKRLRSKIETDPANPTRILTVRGVGYKYRAR